VLTRHDPQADPLLRHGALFRRFVRGMSVKPWHLVVPVGLGLLGAALDGVAMALLVPLARGIAENDFTAAWQFPGLLAVADRMTRLGPFVEAPNRSTFLLLVGLILAATAGRIALTFLSAAAVAYRNALYSARARSLTFARLLQFGKRYFDRSSQGNISTIVGYAEIVPRMVELALSSVNAVLRLAAHVVVMVTISWRLALLMLAVFPLVHLSGGAVMRALRALGQRTTAAELDLSRQVFNTLSSVPLIKVFSREHQSVAHYSRVLERLRGLDVRHRIWSGLPEPLQQSLLLVALGGTALAAVLFTGSDDTAELSTFCAFLVIARQTMPLVGALSALRAQTVFYGPKLDRLADLFDDRDKFFVSDGPREFRRLERGLEIRDLTYAYVDQTPVLRGLSATIRAGDTTAIVGQTGCGKTTLMYLIARLYECPPASIFLDGVDIREFSLRSLRERVTIVGQDPWLFNDTLRANLAYGLDRTLSDAALVETCGRAGLRPFLDRVPAGLDTEIGDRGVRLSGGEKQRISIARALLRDADIWIFDEATASLDSLTENLVQRSVEEATAGKTVIVIAHRLSTVDSADRIMVLADGYLVEEGDWPDLIGRRGGFYRLWHAQTRAGASAV
jgi:subfamily B ATP-binding cassette protein MsbA